MSSSIKEIVIIGCGHTNTGLASKLMGVKSIVVTPSVNLSKPKFNLKNKRSCQRKLY